MATLPDYELAIRILDAIYEDSQSDSLGGLLGSMRINPADGKPMDPAMLADWNRSTHDPEVHSEVDAVIHFLEQDAERYHDVPIDLDDLISKLKVSGSRYRAIADTIVLKSRA